MLPHIQGEGQIVLTGGPHPYDFVKRFHAPVRILQGVRVTFGANQSNSSHVLIHVQRAPKCDCDSIFSRTKVSDSARRLDNSKRPAADAQVQGCTMDRHAQNISWEGISRHVNSF